MRMMDAAVLAGFAERLARGEEEPSLPLWWIVSWRESRRCVCGASIAA